MARGGRGKSRGRGTGATSGAAGFPARAQGTRTSVAQSAGISRTFQGGKGGGTDFSGGGGSRSTKQKGSTSLGNGSPSTIRNGGGDATLIPGAHGGAGRLGLGSPKGSAQIGKGNKGKTNTSIVKPTNLPPNGYGGGW